MKIMSREQLAAAHPDIDWQWAEQKPQGNPPMSSDNYKFPWRQLELDGATFFCKFFGSVRAGSEDGVKFLGFQRERVVLGRER